MKWLATGMALLLGGCAFTRHEPPPAVAPLPTDRTSRDVRERNAAAEPPLDFGQRLDQSHDQVYAWMQALVEAADQRLATADREPQPVPAAPFRIGVTLQALDRSGNAKFRLDGELEVALQLPNTERRLNLFITSDEPAEAPRGSGRGSSVSAGLRRELLRDVSFDVGLKLDAPPVAFTSVRWSREVLLGSISFYPFAKVFLESDDGFGASAAATFDHWSGRTLLRSSTFAKWLAGGDRKDWSQSLVLARAHELIVPERYGAYLRANDIGHGWGVRLLASAENSRRVSFYESGIFFRHPTPNRWLYWFVEPLVRWDRQYDWDADPGIRIGLDALFWDLARPARPQ